MIAPSKVNLGKDFGTSQLIKEHIMWGNSYLFLIVTALSG
jgi:hypothetical protein